MSSQRTPSDSIASIRARSNALSLAAILDTSTGGCCVEQPVIMTDHSQPPVESALVPQPELRETIERDYTAMQGMILGDAQEFEWIIEQLQAAETAINTEQS